MDCERTASVSAWLWCYQAEKPKDLNAQAGGAAGFILPRESAPMGGSAAGSFSAPPPPTTRCCSCAQHENLGRPPKPSNHNILHALLLTCCDDAPWARGWAGAALCHRAAAGRRGTQVARRRHRRGCAFLHCSASPLLRQRCSCSQTESGGAVLVAALSTPGDVVVQRRCGAEWWRRRQHHQHSLQRQRQSAAQTGAGGAAAAAADAGAAADGSIALAMASHTASQSARLRGAALGRCGRSAQHARRAHRAHRAARQAGATAAAGGPRRSERCGGSRLRFCFELPFCLSGAAITCLSSCGP